MNARKQHTVALHWFRRGIRLDDNRALLAALEKSERVVPFFILDPKILDNQSTGHARINFLFQSLRDLDNSLRARGSRLLIRHGEPLAEIERLITETGASLLTFGSEIEPYGRDRDIRITDALNRRGNGFMVETHSDHLLAQPGDIVSKSSGSAYTVYTPFKRVWFDQLTNGDGFGEPQNAPRELPPVPEELHSEPIPDDLETPGQSALVVGGEADGDRWLTKFLTAHVEAYETERNFPAHEGTSRLSAYLRMGVLSPRRVVQKAREARATLPVGRRGGADSWLSELAWRDFYYQILLHFPHVAKGAFKPVYDEIPWDNNEEYFAAWRDGRTGYPIVDAAMRQMRAQAWMHNRARMIVASFLCKDLLCDWRLGEMEFMQQLVDGDQASNNGGWQWAAGTGTDAQPFFRIFNPTAQGEKFDADGAYVKAWLPELAKVPAKFVHAPWKLSPLEQEAVGCVLGRDYPHPIVDHKVQRERALAIYRQTGTAEPTAESNNDAN